MLPGTTTSWTLNIMSLLRHLIYKRKWKEKSQQKIFVLSLTLAVMRDMNFHRGQDKQL
jgi:hypothetical protein